MPIRDALHENDDWACFACAPANRNPDGMNLEFEATEKGCLCRFRLASKFQSYPGYLHGGIVSSILDETMAYVGVFKYNSLPFTKQLKVSYRAAVRVETDYVCVATLTEEGPMRYKAKAQILDNRGHALATAESHFVIPDRKLAARMLGKRFQDHSNLPRVRA